MIDAYQAMVAPLLTLAGHGALWPVPVALALFALLALAIPRLRGKLGERRVANLLDRLGAGEALHDVILPDSRGGLTQVDHLVLTPSGLLVVETKNYRGQIFGQAHDAQWTQQRVRLIPIILHTTA